MRVVETIERVCRAHQLVLSGVLDELRALHARQVRLHAGHVRRISLVAQGFQMVSEFTGSDFLIWIARGQELDDVLPTLLPKDCMGVGRADGRAASFFFSFRFSGVTKVLKAV